MLLLGIDLGTSFIKVSVVDAHTQKMLHSVRVPEQEAAIIIPEPGWAEQSPEIWWEQTQAAILKCHSSDKYNPSEIQAIGISYQMHGLVLVNKFQEVLHNAIIWCDSRAVDLGHKAFHSIGIDNVLYNHLNSPGNFTAAKLAWIKQNKPEIYQQIDKILLPGDFIAMKLTGEINTTISALSEGIFWNFRTNSLSDQIFQHFGFDKDLIPAINPVFSNHGQIKKVLAKHLGLSSSVQVSYKAGDQLNNALSLNVLNPGEVAATAGTSGVIYGVSDKLIYDKDSRVNSFAHVNYSKQHIRTGVLLCINGTGIQNSWLKKIIGEELSYDDLNSLGQQTDVGSKGLRIMPFGNGSERMLKDKRVNSHILNIDFHRHGKAEIVRATQEGIAFAFRYGFDIMRQNGLNPSLIKAGYANLFLSPLFRTAFSNVTNTSLEIYDNDGSLGAALGAGIGIEYYPDADSALSNLKKIKTIEPSKSDLYEDLYQDWKILLENIILT